MFSSTKITSGYSRYGRKMIQSKIVAKSKMAFRGSVGVERGWGLEYHYGCFSHMKVMPTKHFVLNIWPADDPE